jgi:hypothetical protein
MLNKLYNLQQIRPSRALFLKLVMSSSSARAHLNDLNLIFKTHHELKYHELKLGLGS